MSNLNQNRPGVFVNNFLTTLTYNPLADNIFEDLSVTKNVIPGEPIPVTISLWGFTRALDLGNACSIKVYFSYKSRSGNTIREQLTFIQFQRSITLNSIYVKLIDVDPTNLVYLQNPSAKAIDIGDIQALIDAPGSGTELGRMLYAVGSHEIELEITANGKNPGPYVTTGILNVVYENVSSTWWEWDPNNPGSAEWKDSYTISGKCVNQSASGIGFNFLAQLNEWDESYNQNTNGLISVDLPKPQESFLLSFPEIKQSWRWLIEGVWFILPLIGQQFTYKVYLELTDEYGNTYPNAVQSSEVHVQVNVSDKKLAFAHSAFASGISAGVLSAAAIAIPFIAVAAAAAALASAITGALALDPPVPDKKYMEIVDVKQFHLPKGLKEDERFIKIHDFYSDIGFILNSIIALGKIEGKLLGAIADKSKKGIALQKKSYLLVLDEMVKLSEQLSDLTDEASASIIESGLFVDPKIKEIIAGKRKISVGTIKVAGNSKINRSYAKSIHEGLSNPKNRKQLFSPKGITRLFRLMSLPIVGNVDSIKKEANKLLTNYEIVSFLKK